MRKRSLLPVLVAGLLFPVLLFSASAHSGNTDSKGGHINRSTGEYHYHHGYPAHQHESGKCPYEFDDRTGHNSGGSRSGSTKSEKVQEPKEKKNYGYLSKLVDIILMAPIWIPVAILPFWIIHDIISSNKAKKAREQRIYQWIEAYDCTQFDEVFSVPNFLYIDEENETPKHKFNPESMDVFVSRWGGAYHKKSCKYAKGSIPYPMWEAKKHGCHPCKICHPPDYDFSWYREYIDLKKTMKKDGVDLIVKDGYLWTQQ